MWALIGALYGLIVGSFLNVVVLRHGVRTLGGRSACPHCDHTLAAYDLVPVFSWLFLGGACRYCRSAISVQYPLVEATTALLFAFLFAGTHSLYESIVGMAVIGVLVCIAVYDLRHTIIPNAWAYFFAFAAFLFRAPSLFGADTLWDVCGGALLAALPLLALWLVSRGRWMGFGDVELAVGIGILLGVPDGLVAVMSSFILGSLVMLPLLLLGRVTHRYPFRALRLGLTMKSEVPFGPFLIASCLLFWFLQLYGVPFSFEWLSLA